jgi:hypothetical protein
MAVRFILCLCLIGASYVASAEVTAQGTVIDIPTRSGVTQRFLLISAAQPKAVAILFAGGHGGLQLTDTGSAHWGKNNFLVRSVPLFAASGISVALIDAPSDRQSPPYLTGFRQSAEHVSDVRALIAWLKDKTALPVWLIGTSRGTQSVAAVSVTSGGTGTPDGIVLTSTILNDARSQPVPDMALDRLKLPVLVVHHEQDGCRACLFRDVPRLMGKLSSASRKELMAFRGGENRGDPCEGLAYHGYNGLEAEVVARITAWITQ